MDLLRKGEIEALLHEGFLKQMDGEMLPIYYSAALIQDDNLPMIVNSFIDFSDQQSHREKLHKEARTDALTGIGNRRFFKEELDREMGRIRRHGGDLTLLAFDIDHFKKVNDTHGHEAGDRVLQEVSRMAEKTLRRSDILGRTGGEEFTALLVETDLEHAREVAERLRENMQAMHVQVGKTSIAITISIGLAKCDIGMDAETLMRRADEKLYVSKETGRNRVSS